MSVAQSTSSATLRKENITVSSPLGYFLAAQKHFGEENCFFLESLSGPHVDARDTVIGLTGACEVSVTDLALTIAGIEPLCKLVAERLLAQHIVTRSDDGGLELVSPEALWSVPEALLPLTRSEQAAEEEDLGLLVFYGYDTIRYIENISRSIEPDDVTPPDVVFSLITVLVEVNKDTGVGTMRLATGPHLPQWDVAQWLSGEPGEVPEDPQVPQAEEIIDEMTQSQFLDLVKVAQEHIRLGDIYQVQLGHNIVIRSEANPVEVYLRLRKRNPSPYMSILPLAGRLVIGASPELFVRVEDSTIIMRPIAGTARKHDDEVLDARAKERLFNDEKERAEHIMLVDLCRNDCGRVCKYGSIDVTELFTVETYSHLFHLVSHVQATIDSSVSAMDVIKATFPAGTMTGAPKIRAIEIIEDLEISRRGFYAGAFGIVRTQGTSILGLAIRMAVYTEKQFVLRASAGIVADSVPENEWQETLTKMGAVYWAIVDKEIAEADHGKA